MNVKRFWNRCGHYRKLSSLAACDVLPDEHRAEMEVHLAGCTGCRQYSDGLLSVAAEFIRQRDGVSRIELSSTMKARFEQAIKNAQRPWFHEWIAAWDQAGFNLRRLLAANRPAWAALAMVWLMIGFFALSAPSLPRIAQSSPQPSPKQLLTVLIRMKPDQLHPADHGEPPKSNAVDPATPSPRSKTVCQSETV